MLMIATTLGENAAHATAGSIGRKIVSLADETTVTRTGPTPRKNAMRRALTMKLVPTLTALLSTLMLATAAQADKSAGQVVDDNTINATVKSELIGSKETKARSINVETYKGVVQLSGFAATEAEKEAAGRLAKAVDGVREVRNNISIGADTTLMQKLDDSVTTGKVKAALIDSKDVRSNDINVETRSGVVQLSGFVPTDAMREKAGVVALRVEGVKELDNVLQVRPE
jgi:hyperosmotically inducible protein